MVGRECAPRMRTMTAPRPVFPGRFLFITRRCTQRQFLLRPDAETNNAFTYCLAEAAQRFEMEIVLPQMMSNHHHITVWDPYGREVEFREHFHKMLAKSQNALRGRWENMWSTEEPSVIAVLTREDLLERLVYTAANPVLDGLVERVHHWPGPRFVNALLSGTVLKAHRPEHFFDPDGTMPAEVELVLKLPDHVEDQAELLAELERRIAATEEQCVRERQKAGRRVLGRRCVLRQSWRDTPTSHEPRRNLRPRVAARNKWLRIALLQRNKQWLAEYREAFERLRRGLDAEFPYGTYALKRIANVRVKPPLEPN